MMKNLIVTAKFSVLAAAVIVTVGGCSEAVPPKAPLERNELVVRFFDSINHGDSATAARQGKKIYELDPGNDYVVALVTVQESNRFIRQAQAQLNAGRIDAAMEEIRQGVRRHPDNSTLRRMYSRVRQLRNAPRLLNEMRRASAPAEMNAALTAAMTGLSDNISPKLAAYFQDYENRIAKLEKAAAAARKAELIRQAKAVQKKAAAALIGKPPVEPKVVQTDVEK